MEIKISAAIITFNEERNIERCLNSLEGILDEIVVVDSYSTDNTKSICLAKKVKFLERKFDGHIQQKNWAKDQATYNYVLSLDADEAISEDLKKSILAVKADWQNDAYELNRLTNYCGKWIHHSAWYPDKKLRLFDRRKGKWGGNNPHDKYLPETGAKVGFLKGDLLHYSYYTKKEHLNQIEKFSTIGAKALFEKGKKSSYFKMTYKALARFIKGFIIYRGFLDGKAGFTIATYSAYSNWLKYKKLMQLQKGGNLNG